MLDILVFLAENWLILFFGPLLAAGLTYLWVSMTPETYTATAVIEAPAHDIFDEPLEIEIAPLHQEAAKPRPGIQVNFTDTGAEIRATSSSPEEVTDLVLAAYADIVEPLNKSLRQRRDKVNEVIAQLDPIANALRERAGDDIASAVAFVQTQDQILPLRIQTIGLEAAISVLGDEPEVLLATNRRSAALPSLLAAFGMGFALLVVLAARTGWMAASTTADGSRKIARIKGALRLRSVD